MDCMFMDNKAMNNLSRRTTSLSVLNLNSNVNHRYYNSLYPTTSSRISQLFLDPQNMTNFPVSLHPPSLYSSLPITINGNNSYPQPPLLPLPSSIKKIHNNNNNNNQKKKKKKKNGFKKHMKPTKFSAVRVMEANSPDLEKKVGKKEEEEEDTEEEFLIVPSTVEARSVDYCSLSPPPSSLPFPRLLLTRVRAAATKKSSCVAEAMADSGEADGFLQASPSLV